MKRGFLKSNRNSLYKHTWASDKTAQESLKRGPSSQAQVFDITEGISKAPKASITVGNAEQTTEMSVSMGKFVPEPNFKDKTKSFLNPHIIHRVPSLATTQSKEPSSFCMLWSTTLEKITSTPGYPGTIPKTRPNVFTIRSAAPSMGLGLFAKDDIKVTELILAERPLLIVPPIIPIIAEPEQAHFSEAEMRKIGHEQYERNLEMVLGLMTKEDETAFRNLENRHPENGYNLFGILLTNGYPMRIDKDSTAINYRAIGKKGSRINHSCTPNLFVDFDIPSFSLQYTAIRDIKAGEQLFYAYCNPMQPAKERQEALDKYKFVCRCTACENATPESDKLREKYGRDPKKTSDEWKEVLLGSEFKTDALESLLDMEKEMMKEGLDFWMQFPLLLDAIAEVYVKLNDHKKASEYKQKLARYNPKILKAVKGDRM